EDHTIRTSLLDARLVVGSDELFDAFNERFAREMLSANQMDFVKAKLDERDNRHDRMGDSRYVLEPNIKEGKGGLRDLQTLYWIAKAIYRIKDVSELVPLGVFDTTDVKRFMKAQDFLWTVRCHLHFSANRAEEILSFNVQGDLAKRMGYRNRPGSSGVERFMKHYFLVAKDVGDLTRVLCAMLEENHGKKTKRTFLSFGFFKGKLDNFNLDNDRLNIKNKSVFSKDPINLLRLFAEAERLEADIHPEALRSVYKNLKLIDANVLKNVEANEMFIDMLIAPKGPELTLRRLNEAGILGRFIPDFGRVVAQMQYDMYHVYTVDEHTINAIGILNKIELGLLAEDHPLSTKIIQEIKSRRVLYVAVLLHDIGKGRGGDHSEIGAKIAKKLCPRFGLDEWETETVVWLVLHHLDMNRTAFKRDLDDPQTIKDFIKLVQTPERLRLLLILTVADTRAVGPNVWNGWKATLLRELYSRALEAITGKAPGGRAEARAMDIKEKLEVILTDGPDGWSREELDAHMALGYTDYWLSFDMGHLARHAKLIRRANKKESNLHLESTTDPGADISEIIVYTADHPGLFSRIAGAMALGGANIVDARVVTMANGMALDTFWVQDVGGGAYDGPKRIKRLEIKIEAALTGKINPKVEIEKEAKRQIGLRTAVFTVPPRVLVDNKASMTATVIEISARNRTGLLHDITWALTGLGLQIISAHITSYGERAVDVFYVKDVFGLKVDQDAKIKSIESKLMSIITASADKKTKTN
ncbi:MAG: [protein-PII] uridylyltransferase, partial [Rhodospirillaceae bacterium]|nr:[protein-PII] uridylyltransferase [Rhodospirillaceae bacterium]